MSFIQYLKESSEKSTNPHLSHVEDLIIEKGTTGGSDALNHIEAFIDMLGGNSKSKLNVTSKVDGSPAIVCGINPENGKFFVGTKSVFSKNSKAAYTLHDIARFFPDEGLASKMRVALKELSALGIRGILMGDLMFTKADLKKHTVDGEDCVVFKPNTITYAVPLDSELGQHIVGSHLGIVFHTTYTGTSLNSLKATYGVDLSNLRHTSRVWFKDSKIKDVSGTATFTQAETYEIETLVSEARKELSKIDSTFLNGLIASPSGNLFSTFINSQVRKGSGITDPKAYAHEFLEYIQNKFAADAAGLKTDSGKATKEAKLKELLSLLNKNMKSLVSVFKFQKLITDAKKMILIKLDALNDLKALKEVPGGYEVSDHEGLVAVDHIGNAVKLVGRLSFSMRNFQRRMTTEETLLVEGGSAVSGVVPIHQENVAATIQSIYKLFLPKFKLSSSHVRMLGSTGKKAPGSSSGDIDLAIDISSVLSYNGLETMDQLYDWVVDVCKTVSPQVKDSRSLGVISIPWAITNADGKQPNSHVQLDLFFVDSLDYASFIYHGPHYTESALKGIYRNILLSAIAMYMDYKTLKTHNGEESVRERNMFDFTKGLMRGVQSREGKKGLVKSFKTIDKELISNKPDEIAKMLFGPKYKAKDIMTFEAALAVVLNPQFIYRSKKLNILATTKENILNAGYPVPEILEREL